VVAASPLTKTRLCVSFVRLAIWVPFLA
jgi:hypothetical protein